MLVLVTHFLHSRCQTSFFLEPRNHMTTRIVGMELITAHSVPTAKNEVTKRKVSVLSLFPFPHKYL